MPITARITQGNGCIISNDATIGYREHGGQIILGNNVQILGDALLRTCTGIIKVGDRTSIGYGVIIHALGGVTIGSKTMISPRVQIYAQNHGISRRCAMIKQEQTAEGITIGNDCWIGAGAIICDGVHIEKGCVIGAGAVVTRGTYTSYGIYAGNPAVKIGDRQ